MSSHFGSMDLKIVQLVQLNHIHNKLIVHYFCHFSNTFLNLNDIKINFHNNNNNSTFFNQFQDVLHCSKIKCIRKENKKYYHWH